MPAQDIGSESVSYQNTDGTPMLPLVCHSSHSRSSVRTERGPQETHPEFCPWTTHTTISMRDTKAIWRTKWRTMCHTTGSLSHRIPCSTYHHKNHEL